MESKDLIQDIKDATDGLGPHAAVIAAGIVSQIDLHLWAIVDVCIIEHTIQPGYTLSAAFGHIGSCRNAKGRSYEHSHSTVHRQGTFDTS